MNRQLPTAVHVAHSSWVWVVEVPRITSSDRGAGGDGPNESLAILRAMAADAPPGTALQVRYTTEAIDGAGRPVPYLVGRARTEDEAVTLARLVALTLPEQFGFRPVDQALVPHRLVPFGLDGAEPGNVVELRRVIDTIDPARPVVIPWSPARHDTDFGDLLVRAGSPTLLCIHVERCEADEELVEQLHATLHELSDEPGIESDPALQRSLAAHRAWLRELPGGALQVRVMLIADQTLAPGLADLTGLAVTDGAQSEHGGYRITRPANRHELDLALQIVDDVRAGIWGVSSDDASLLRCPSSARPPRPLQRSACPALPRVGHERSRHRAVSRPPVHCFAAWQPNRPRSW